jgi:hypothetical protein
MGKRVRLKRGDIFRFDLDEARYGLGQIIDEGVVFYMVIFRVPVDHDFNLESVDTRDILLCGRTTDAQFYHGRWHMVGNLPVPQEAIPRPCAKVAREGEQWIVDFHGKPVRPATSVEWQQLDYQNSRSPILYEDAFKAHHGIGAIKPHYAKYSVEHMRAQAALCPDRKRTWFS